MQLLHDVKTAIRFTKQLRSARTQGADRIEARPVWTVPQRNLSLWGATMEFCILANHASAETRHAVCGIFDTLPKETQYALTFTPKAPEEWTARTAFWRHLLRPALPEKDFYHVMGCLEHWYAHCKRMRNSTRADTLT